MRNYKSIFLLLMFGFAQTAKAGDNSTITYQGRIVHESGAPIEALTTFQFVVRAPNNCILWSENQTIDLRETKGVFSAIIGSGSNLSSGFHSFSQVFRNENSLTSLAGCSSGSTYDPAPNDDRTLYVSFNDGKGPQALAGIPIKSVPFASFASSSLTVQTLLGKIFDTSLTPTAAQVLRFNAVSDKWESKTLVASDISGLGGAATLGVGTVSSSVAAGNDSRFPSAACLVGEKSRWDGSAWVCELDADSASAGASVTLTGQVTGVGAGTVATTISNNSITTPKVFANPGINRLVATDPTTGSTLVPLVCPTDQLLVWHLTNGWQCTAQSALAVGSASIAGNISGTLAVSKGGTGVGSLPACGVAEALKFDGSAWSCISIASGAITDLTGDVTASGTGSVVATIAPDAVTSGKILDGAIVDADINAAAGIVDTKLATISTVGKVSNSATTATSANTVSAIVARDASGNFSAGTITATFSGNGSALTNLDAGDISSGVLAVARGGTGTGLLPSCGASQALKYDGASWTCVSFSSSALVELTGDVTTTGSGTVAATISADAVTSGKILDGAIVNADINAAAGIVDTKLATIATAGKVSNSATTATSANTVSAIVARDVSGNFSAGTITATFSGNGSALTNLDAGDISSGVLAVARGGTGTGLLPSCGASQALKYDGASWTCVSFSSSALVELTGDVTTAGSGTVAATISADAVTSGKILDGAIVDADINAAAGIVDTKLATIATSGKVSNSATTATSANTVSAIVARDVSGNFSAGTVTATFVGNGSGLTNLDAGDIATGTLPLTRGGTGATTQAGAANNIMPSQTGSAGEFLTTDGTNVAWGPSPATAVGSVLTMATATCPVGWLTANGTAVSRATYANLFAAMGTMYGVGDGVTTFNLPDYRGEFLRGWANGSGNDPDRASRTNRGDGTTGDNVGTKQGSNMVQHNHAATGLTATIAADGAHSHAATGLTATTGSAGSHSHSFSGSDTFTDNNVTGNTGSWDDENNAGTLIRSLSASNVVETVTISGNTDVEPAHTHTVTVAGNTASSGTHSHTATMGGNTANSGAGTETRSRNVNVLYCIRY